MVETSKSLTLGFKVVEDGYMGYGDLEQIHEEWNFHSEENAFDKLHHLYGENMKRFTGLPGRPKYDPEATSYTFHTEGGKDKIDLRLEPLVLFYED